MLTELFAGTQTCAIILHNGDHKNPTVWGTGVSSVYWTTGQETGVVTTGRRRVACMGLHTNWKGSLRKAALWEGFDGSLSRRKNSLPVV